jgi:hypothetical protein
MDDQTTEGASWYLARALDTSDPAPLDTVSRWAGAQSAQLETVAAGLPADSTDDVTSSLGLLHAITDRADGWRTALDCPQEPGPAPAGPDRLGPVPGACVVAVETPQTAPTSPVPSEPVPGAPAPAPLPVDPTPGGTPPQAAQGTTPGEPGAPALPTGTQPVPGIPQVPGPPTLPTAPPLELDLPGGLPTVTVPSLTLPSLPPRSTAPASPSAGPTPSKPAVNVPLPVVPCAELPPLVRLGEC